MGGGGKIGNPKDMAVGAALQCVEAATLGMPFEVWKTRMGKFREESTMQAFRNVHQRAGIAGFWQGTSAKLVESALKGAILLYAKEAIMVSTSSSGMSPTQCGILAGAGGGVAQVSVMGPCTFLVTCVVTGDKNMSITKKIRDVWAEKGIKGFYPGGTALMFRQGSNWASRQGFTEAIREQFMNIRYSDKIKKGESVRLSAGEEAICGMCGGALSTWNQPFEVARIDAQSRANQGLPSLGMMGTLSGIYKEAGVAGLFQGIVPRIGLGVWQTLFMVSGAKDLQNKNLPKQSAMMYQQHELNFNKFSDF